MASQTALSSRQRERILYTAMALVAAGLVFTGFARTYYLKGLFGAPSLSPLLHAHGFVFSAWFVLLITQVVLVARKRTDLHRRLGVAGMYLAPVMVVVGLATAISAAKKGVTIPGGPPPLVFLAIPIFDIVVFGSVIGAAFYYRHKPAVHKRLMIAGSLGIMAPAVARLPLDFIVQAGPVAYFGIPDLILVAAIGYDTITHRRLHPAFLWSGLLIILSHPLRFLVAGTDAWMTFASWATGS